MKRLLIDSLNRKETIVIFYLDRKMNVTKRFIRVLGIQAESIVAFCYWRRQVRRFNLSQILAADRTGRKKKHNKGAATG